MKWTDSLEIAIALDEKYPHIDPLTIGFVELRNKVLDLEEFDDIADKSGEKILEAIQMMWLDER